jgi:eukaryotic-like serine/threonine-protein kinase
MLRALFATCFMLTLCGARVEAKPPAPSMGQKYTNDLRKFSLSFPKNWEVRENIMGATVVGLAPTSTSSGKAEEFRENINIVVETLPQTMTTKSYYDESLKLLKKLFTDFKIEKTGHGSFDRQVAQSQMDKSDPYWTVYTHRMGKLRAKVLQYMSVVGKTAFVITCSATPQTYEKFRPMFEASIKTFKASE